MEATGQRLIFAIGNPLLDISANGTQEQIEKYGLVYGGAILAEEQHKPLFDELWKTEGMETIAGGSAMNTIRCANVS